ncbi:MAG TPA: TolC family protein, partial [Plasticicumulans sp.]|nr:TolC family protein [Plasticicumulans sp.]
NAGIGVAEAAYYPSLNFSASAGFEAASLAKWISAPARVWALGPQLALTLFDGGARAAQVEAAGASWQGTVASYRQTVLTGFQEVEDALATLRILAAEAAVQDRAVTAARRSLELTMNQYRAGILAYLGVVVVQAQALAAESSAIDLQGRRLAASVALIRALGGSWQAGDPSLALTRADTR